MRDLDAGVLEQMFAEAQEASQRFAAEERCTVEWTRIWSIEPIPFDPHLIALALEAVGEVAGPAPQLPSGPLHDAAEVARAGIPTVDDLRAIPAMASATTSLEDTRRGTPCRRPSKRSIGLAHKTLAWLAKPSSR